MWGGVNDRLSSSGIKPKLRPAVNLRGYVWVNGLCQ